MMFGEKRNPMDELEQLLNQFGINAEAKWESGFSQFPVDVVEDDGMIHVSADLPGYTKEDISVDTKNNTLIIRADRDDTKETTTDDDHYVLNERRNTVSRRISLPEYVDITTAQASYNNGVLSVTFDKIMDTDDSESSINIE